MTVTAPDPLIVHLFGRMPEPGSVWPETDRAVWFKALESVLNLVYRSDDNISITTQPTVMLEPPKLPAVVEAEEVEPVKPVRHVQRMEGSLTRGPARPPEQKLPAGPRPAGIPTNLQMSLEAIDHHEGKATSIQIEKFVREKYWSDVRVTWKNCLWTLATEFKIARDGINFTRAVPKSSVVVAPKPATPKAPAAPKQYRAEALAKFAHNDRVVELPSRGYVLASKLKASIGKHIPEAFLAEKVMGNNSEANRDIVRSTCLNLNDDLATVGLNIGFFKGFGLIMKEIDVV